MIKINEIPIGVTTTDVVRDLTSISVSKYAKIIFSQNVFLLFTVI